MSKNVLITGATSGIGEATARAFAKEGENLILTGRRVERLEALKEELQATYPDQKVWTFALDVTDMAMVKDVCQAILKSVGQVHVLVNNAGLALGLTAYQDYEEWDLLTMLDTNVKGLMKSLLEKPSYQELKAKMTVVRPQESVVGVMLYWDKAAKLVASDGIGIAQHNVLLWQIDLETNDFVYEDQPTDLSQRLKETFQEWIETLPNQELKQVCDLFFDTILDSGIESLDDIGIKTCLLYTSDAADE